MTKKRKRRKLKKGFKIFIVIFSITLISIIGYIIIKPSKDNKTISKPNIINKNEDKHYEASLIAVGDYLIHSSVYKDANRLANGDGYDFKPMISYIKEIVSNYDIAYYNQETILGGSELGLSDYPTFNSPYEAGDAMLDAGFNLVSLATNHTMDSGKKAVENSCKYWQSKENVLTAGSYCSEEERNKINIKEINNIKYTMLNYTYGTNGMPVANDYLVNVWPTDIDNINNPEKDTKYQAYKKQVKEDIDKVFNKFYRVEQSRSVNTGGTGLGLAIAKNIAMMHGGDIVVQSDLYGTIFDVTLSVNYNKEKYVYENRDLI